ncbi:uncharacterized protein [Rhodnius prolixus]|uniref:Uncharacterized protein n=1 Tax=Rhodnius prolixus TaxID=13249 RepID=T1HRW9_RHOPR
MYLPSAFSLLCCAVALINGDGVDDIIDEILYEGEQYLKDNHLEIVQIPDVNVTYDNVKLDGTVYNGFINGKNGKLQNTTTLRRIDDAKIDFIGDDQMILRLNVSFASLSVHYDVFNFKLWIASSEGGADVNIADNEFHLKMVLLDNDKVCNVTIAEAYALKFTSIDLHLLPPSVSNYVKNKIYSSYLSSHPDVIPYAFNPITRSFLQTCANSLDVCSYIKLLRKSLRP